MSILLDAIKKSQQGTKAAIEQSKAGGEQAPSLAATAVSPPAPAKFSLAKISFFCALVAMFLYSAIIALSGKPAKPAMPEKKPAVAEQKTAAVETSASVTTSLPPALEGIIWDPEAPLAILAGKPVKPGDTAGGWTVQSITETAVQISQDGKTETLSLPNTPATK